MAVSGVNNYRDVLFQWQGQQLKSTGNKTASSAASSLFGSSSMTSQLSSMIELTKYAMDAMGVGSDSRVTFSQINKYRDQLQSEFNASVKNGLAQSGISDLTQLSFNLDKNGKITVTGANAEDRKSAQAWFDANPGIGQDLRQELEEGDIDREVSFTISSTGRLSLIDTTGRQIQAELDKDSKLTSDLREALKKIGVTLDNVLEFKFSDSGQLEVKGNHADAEKINVLLSSNQDLANAVKNQLEKHGVESTAATLRLGKDGNIQININNAENNDIQHIFDNAGDIGQKITSALNNLGIDKNIKFSIQVNDDGTINIISDHPDRDKVQAFFEQNPDLVKKYRQIETLSGIDDARKAMQISPAEMRKRIQIESMASWWFDSDNSSSYFGNYYDGNLSILSGLNLKV